MKREGIMKSGGGYERAGSEIARQPRPGAVAGHVVPVCGGTQVRSRSAIYHLAGICPDRTVRGRTPTESALTECRPKLFGREMWQLPASYHPQRSASSKPGLTPTPSPANSASCQPRLLQTQSPANSASGKPVPQQTGSYGKRSLNIRKPYLSFALSSATGSGAASAGSGGAPVSTRR